MHNSYIIYVPVTNAHNMKETHRNITGEPIASLLCSESKNVKYFDEIFDTIRRIMCWLKLL